MLAFGAVVVLIAARKLFVIHSLATPCITGDVTRSVDVAFILKRTRDCKLYRSGSCSKFARDTMLLRVRFADGETVRVDVSGSGQDLLEELGAQILSLDRTRGPFTLFHDIGFRESLKAEKLSHGDFVFVHGSPGIDHSLGEPHGSNQNMASQASSSSNTEAQVTASNSTNVQEDPGTSWRPRCMHGPKGMCEHCMPKEDKKSRYERELAKWKGRGMSIAVMEALEALKIRVKAQENPHVSAAVVDNDSASQFQEYLARISFSQQRIGVCYGTYDAQEKETTVSAIYEPPQSGSHDTYDLIEGSEAGDMDDRAEKLAALLGLSCVGVVISARPRKCILSAKDIVFMAKMVQRLPESARRAFVVLLVSETETGETAFEAYQLSDQASDMYKQGAFSPLDEQKPNAGRVLTKEEVLVEGKETRKVHTEFFLVNVPIKTTQGRLRTAFPVENRDLTPQGPADVASAVADSSGLPYGKRLADFHLLLFLTTFFDMETDMPGLVGAVQAECDTIEEGYRLMIDSIASSS